jgi:drug/metabolite transporter (DMT)-like permease
MRRDQVRVGVLSMLFGTAAFGAHDMVGKIVVERYPVTQMLALRAGMATLFLLPAVRRRGGFPPLNRGNLPGHGVRLAAMLGAILLFFSAVRQLPLADATAIFFVSPFVMTALSAPLLRERVPRAGWVAVAVGFVGVLVVVRPTGHVEAAALFALAAGSLYPLGMVMTRRMSRTETVFALMFWMIVGQFVAAALTLPFVWEPVRPAHWLLIAVLAGLNLLGHVGVTHAFHKAPVAKLAPLEYSALVWAAVFGFLVWGDVPSARVWVGVAIIAGAGIYTTVRAGTQSEPVPLPGQTA